MLELMICSLLTIVPDYLYRRYAQGKQIGKEITIYSVWFELRYGITACLMLTISLITVIFYNHPSTHNATLYFRAVPIVPETNGRVAEVHVGVPTRSRKARPFSHWTTSSRRRLSRSPAGRSRRSTRRLSPRAPMLSAAEGKVQEAKGAEQQALDELRTKEELMRKGHAAPRDIEKLQVMVAGRQGTVASAMAAKDAAEARVSTFLPAEKSSAEAALTQAEVDLEKTVIRAGVSGRVQQFTLRVGDIVNPMMRPAGVLIPESAGRQAIGRLQSDRGAGDEDRHGCRSHMRLETLDHHPMVVTGAQDFIAAGQVRGGEQLIDPADQAAGNPPRLSRASLRGRAERGNARQQLDHERLHEQPRPNNSGKLGTLHSFALHAVDAVGLVHALILRIQALVFPIQTLVLGGGH